MSGLDCLKADPLCARLLSRYPTERGREGGNTELSRSRELCDIKSLLVDMDGVLYRGREPVPGAKEFLDFARRRGIPFLLFTNNSTLTPMQYVRKLAAMGIPATEDEIFTSAQATAMYLPKLIPLGSPIYVIGQDGLFTALQESGYRFASTDVSAVVVGMDTQLTFEKLKIATLAIRRGARFVATNPDATLPTEEGLIPGNGAILAALRVATDVEPLIIGKPERPIFEAALRRLGAEVTTTAIIGDRPETDIIGGQRAGLMTILVLTGVTDLARQRALGIEPDWIFEDLPALQRALAHGA